MLTPIDKLNAFMLNPSVEHLLTVDEFNELTPFEKGLCSYMQSSWDQSEIEEDINPYDAFLFPKEYEQFMKGSHAAMIMVQDMEE